MKHRLPAILATITLFCVPFLSAGQETAPVKEPRRIGDKAGIEGAFGLKLDDKFTPDPKTRIDEGQYQGGYRFTPQKPNPQFSEYIVFIAPNSHRIYRIVAVSSYEWNAQEKGFRFSERLRNYLASKYGSLIQVTRFISVNNVSEKDKLEVTLEYLDAGVQSIAVEEQISNDLQGFDGEGL